jgi:site-specific DNA-methyltransferase (adenine-specific)
MQDLIDDGVKVDLVLTDLPYGTTANGCDTVIPFDKMWSKLNQLSSPITTFALFGSEPFSTSLRHSNLNDYKYDLYWIKNRSTGFVHCKNKPLKNIELISVFSKGTTVHKNQSKNRMTYNPQGLKKSDKIIKAGDSKFGTMNGKRPSHKKEYVQEYTNYPKMTIFFDTVPTNQIIHPTQKPLDLLGYLIRTYSDEGDVVLDFTMGGGSTGVACLQTNRNFIGIELEQKYFEIAEQRIKEAKAQRRLI